MRSSTVASCLFASFLARESFAQSPAPSSQAAPVAANASRAGLPAHEALRAALTQARKEKNGGFDLDMWAAIVDRDGVVQAIAFTGRGRGDQWPGSRVIAAQKANTANAFSLPGLALSTANLFTAVQPGGSLFGLQASNPVDVSVAYRGNAEQFGQPNDPMVGGRIGGVNVFGGGLPLYDAKGTLVGAIGVSGDTSCADHNIAWRTRSLLQLDYVPAGVSGDAERPDNIVFDIAPDANAHLKSKGGFGHPHAIGGGEDKEKQLAAALPAVRKKA
ncbi:MAG TPA: heme-binding protein [Planctomycetota bacterium]